MAAFTTFSDEALARFLVMFELYDDIKAIPIETGIENSNYHIHVDGQHFVLTIAAALDFDEVAFFNEIFGALANTDVPVPTPLRTLDGMSSTIFCGKPTWLFTYLSGVHPDSSGAEECRQIGQALATIHTTLKDNRYHRDSPYDLAWSEATFAGIKDLLADDDARSLAGAIDIQRSLLDGNTLPRGTIHGDLFRDNTLFDDSKLTGVLDFYHACEDVLIMDLAIAINDWCPHNAEHQAQLLSGYSHIRSLTDEERDLLPAMRQVAAMRFILTRLTSGEPAAGEPGQPLKDPTEFLRLLATLE